MENKTLIRFNSSLDKIRIILSANVSTSYSAPQMFRDVYLLSILREGWFMPKEMFISGAVSGFRFNYTFQKCGSDEGVIYLGLISNNPRVEFSRNRICLEYNPNKVSELPNALFRWLRRSYGKYLGVASCDIAFDFSDILPNEIRFFTKAQHMTFNDSTFYIRAGGSHLAIKIYDKTKERSRFDRLEENLNNKKQKKSQISRVEITLKNPQIHEKQILGNEEWDYLTAISSALAEIFIPSDMPLLMYDIEQKYGKLDPALLYALQHLDPDQQRHAISLLGSKAAAKYRAALKAGDYESFNIDELTLSTLISDLLNKELQKILLSISFPPDPLYKYKYHPNPEPNTDFDSFDSEPNSDFSGSSELDPDCVKKILDLVSSLNREQKSKNRGKKHS